MLEFTHMYNREHSHVLSEDGLHKFLRAGAVCFLEGSLALKHSTGAA